MAGRDCDDCGGYGSVPKGAGSPDWRSQTGAYEQCRACSGTGEHGGPPPLPGPPGLGGDGTPSDGDGGGFVGSLILVGIAGLLVATAAVIDMVGDLLVRSERFQALVGDLIAWVDQPDAPLAVPIAIALMTPVVASTVTIARRISSRAWLRDDSGLSLGARLMLFNVVRAGVYIVGFGSAVASAVMVTMTGADVAESPLGSWVVAELPGPWPWLVVGAVVLGWAGATTYMVRGKYWKLAGV